MTLALLITAATGAWADSFSTEAYTADATLSAVSVTGNTTLTINEGVTVTVNNGLTINSGATLTVTGGGNLIVNGSTGANGGDGNSPGGEGSTAIGGSGQLAIANATITATGGAGGKGGFDEYSSQYGGDGAPAVSGVSISIQTGSLTAIGGAGGIGGTSTVYNQKYPDGETAKAFSSFPNISDATLSYSTDNVTYTKYESGNTALYRYMKIEPLDGPAVTIADGNGEASFKMPQYDVTATYTLKRDLSVETQVTVGDDHSAQPRYRVQKQGNTFQPVGMDQAQVMALFHVHDQIENQDLAPVQDYTVLIYPVDIEGQPTGDAITFQNFTYAPGQYIVKAVAKDGSNYVGQTLESNIFTLYQGYEIVVAAKEYATYYKDENLTLDESETAAGLYTVSSVTDNAAVVSEKIQVAPANTPLLVYNESEEARNILLIPTTDEASTVSVASEFKGTLTEQEMSASSDAVDYYVLNGSSFVWVKNAGTIAANRCWLQLAKGAATARTLPLVFDDATGINAIGNADLTTGSWYDLNGRKLTRKPAAKGVYILNGRKVVVK